MTSVGQSAAGIMVASQNSGIASLVQQGINVQANLAVGR
ncbi:MAG: signal peptide protein [Polaromonas sp. 39-63-203]|nr:MAG: signal peptide protein [Polaromonas sp. 24-62-144]OZA95677.1 MAG: signal peptide protein [Polaromonas sp. 39-63-203]